MDARTIRRGAQCAWLASEMEGPPDGKACSTTVEYEQLSNLRQLWSFRAIGSGTAATGRVARSPASGNGGGRSAKPECQRRYDGRPAHDARQEEPAAAATGLSQGRLVDALTYAWDELQPRLRAPKEIDS
jgi:hypothetical protein